MNNPLLEVSGLPCFNKILPEHVEPALKLTLTRNRAKLESLLNDTSEPNFSNTILEIEKMIDRLHRVWAPINHLNMVASNKDLRDAYNRCLPLLSDYSTEITQNEKLFSVYKKVADTLDHESSIEGKLVEISLRDFKLAGVNLTEEIKSDYRSAISKLTQLEARFEQNILDAMAAWSYHTQILEELKGIPKEILQQAVHHAKGEGLNGWLFKLDQPTYVGIITHADNRLIREKFYRAWVTRCSDKSDKNSDLNNHVIMNEILKLRHQIANLIGFKSFAEYVLETRMAKSVTEVEEFLNNLAEISLPVAQKEYQQLKTWSGLDLAAWDINYYSEKMRQEKFLIADEVLRPFFPLDTVLDGLFGVITKLYDIQFKEEKDVETWNNSVRFYRAFDSNNDEIGGIFLDLFARENKRAGAWMDECILLSKHDGKLEKPVAHLVCNFTEPNISESALLNHDEIVTLFHECGHVLHHLLTTIDYPSIAGTRVAWDAVELPSQFMENFAWDPKVLKKLSSHIDTGETLPEEMLSQINNSRVFLAGINMIRQLEFALFDWKIHKNYKTNDDGQIQKTLKQVRDKINVIKPPEYNRLANSFSHVFGGSYAAGYYSYKWAEVLAADAFMAFQKSDLFNEALAKKFRKEILEIGGSRDFNDAYQAFRGRPANIEALLTQSGIMQDD
ncbi:MAG: M3 family metallopeptidase [Pseudomonadota bacterium]|nr:M3 family metallopeptidase [Pseudomonadota bacterium]